MRDEKSIKINKRNVLDPTGKSWLTDEKYSSYSYQRMIVGFQLRRKNVSRPIGKFLSPRCWILTGKSRIVVK